MKRINEFINKKLKISKNYKNDTMQVPSEIDTEHQRYLNKLYDIIQRKVVREKIDEDGDLSSLVKYYEEYTKNDIEYQTPEMIWAYISIVLGYEYMFDDSSDERWKNRYLSKIYDETDPIEEFVYRAAEHANNYHVNF